MINLVRIMNFGPIRDLNWKNVSNMNLIIGPNGMGKTYLMKALYTTTRSLEDYERGKDYRRISDILADRLYWNFQTEKIGDLVRKGTDEKLSVEVNYDNNVFDYTYGKDTKKQINSLENNVTKLNSTSLFLPAKEVLSLQKVILKSRDIDKEFGFDNTYYELAKALTQLTQKGRNIQEFSQSRILLKQIIKGKLEFDESKENWIFRNENNQKMQISMTSEGVKKIAIFDTLLGNRYLGRDSIVFIDEPEAALHPAAISKFLDIIALLSQTGVQFFLASHSYFVIKKLCLIAQKEKVSIPVISNECNNWVCDDLIDGMPENSIIKESIKLYEEEIEGSLIW